MKRHSGRILARASVEEITRFYAEIYVRRVEKRFPLLIRGKMKTWIFLPLSGLIRLAVAFFVRIRALWPSLRRILKTPWRTSPILASALISFLSAGAILALLDQWPNPALPLDVEGLLLTSADADDIRAAWSDEERIDDCALLNFEIPPELYPVQNAPSSIQLAAAIDRPDIESTILSKDNIAASAVLTTKKLPKETFSPKPIPPNGVHHKIRSGETLWDIAKAYGVKCDLLERFNPDINPRRMQLDQKIFIPGANSPIVIPRKSKMISPIAHTVIVSGFGMRKHPLGGVLRFHRGIDLKANTGTPVRAVMDGVIVEAGWQGTLGRYIKIKHSGGFETVYAHNSRIKVKKGERVKMGQTISLSGNTGRSTGPHLHFEVIKNGKHVDPVQYLPQFSQSSSSRYARK